MSTIKKKGIHNPVTGKYYEVKQKTNRTVKAGRIKGLWSFRKKKDIKEKMGKIFVPLLIVLTIFILFSSANTEAYWDNWSFQGEHTISGSKLCLTPDIIDLLFIRYSNPSLASSNFKLNGDFKVRIPRFNQAKMENGQPPTSTWWVGLMVTTEQFDWSGHAFYVMRGHDNGGNKYKFVESKGGAIINEASHDDLSVNFECGLEIQREGDQLIARVRQGDVFMGLGHWEEIGRISSSLTGDVWIMLFAWSDEPHHPDYTVCFNEICAIWQDNDNDDYYTDCEFVTRCEFEPYCKDCNDSDSDIYPGATELCDGIDNDCDWGIDDPNEITYENYYRDADGDGYGDPNKSRYYCKQPDSYVFNSDDCNDKDPNINPDAIEIPCNGNDENCDGKGYDMIEDPNCCPFYLTLIDSNTHTSYSNDLYSCHRDLDIYHWIVKIEKAGFLDPNDYPLLIWDPNELRQEDGYIWMLARGENENGDILVFDMTSVDSYHIKEEDGEYLSILWTNNLSSILHLQKGWNLISLPVVPNSLARKDVFPQAMAVWHFDSSQRTYVFIEKDDPMEPYIGYWVLVDQEMDHEFSGSPVIKYTLELKDTWNMIGSLFNQTSISLSQGDIKALYGFKKGYYLLDLENLEGPVLETCMGYWILPSKECKLSAEVD